MNPFEVERLGWEEIRGLPIVADPNRHRSLPDHLLARQGGRGHEEAEALGIPIEVAVPATPGRSPSGPQAALVQESAASLRRCSRASGWSAPSSVKIATITRRSRSLRSGSCSAASTP